MIDCRRFLFPGGEDAAGRLRAIRTVQRGRMRSAPNAKWIEFTATEQMDSTRSAFRWEARFGLAFQVIDAYEHGHGQLAMKFGRLIPVKKLAGPELDKGELQRYLAALASCPPMLLNNTSLEWTQVSERILRVRDRDDPAGTVVDHEFGDDGRPLVCRAQRPRTLGKELVLTP